MPSVAIGIVGSQLVVADTPMPKASSGMSELIKRLRDHGIERIAFDRGVTADEINAFVHAIASLGGRGGSEHSFNFPHIHVGRITADEKRDDGIGSDMAAIRQLYSNAVAAAESVWESAVTEGMPDMPAALQAVDGLAEAVTQNRTALRRADGDEELRQLHVHAHGERVDPDDGPGARARHRRARCCASSACRR